MTFFEHPDTDIPYIAPGKRHPVKNNVDAPHIKDSGDRTQFETGAVRDMREGKGRCDLMPLDVVGKYMELVNSEDKIIHWLASFQHNGMTLDLYNALECFCTINYSCDPSTMFLEVAKHFEEGAKKYGENNWQKGIPVYCYIDSAVRHYLKWLREDTDEPHDRAFVWNILCAIWTRDYMPELNSYAKEDLANGVVVREKGEWIVCGDGDNVPWMCSHCGKTTAHKYKVMYGNFCPNCGADMRGAVNDG